MSDVHVLQVPRSAEAVGVNRLAPLVVCLLVAMAAVLSGGEGLGADELAVDRGRVRGQERRVLAEGVVVAGAHRVVERRSRAGDCVRRRVGIGRGRRGVGRFGRRFHGSVRGNWGRRWGAGCGVVRGAHGPSDRRCKKRQRDRGQGGAQQSFQPSPYQHCPAISREASKRPRSGGRESPRGHLNGSREQVGPVFHLKMEAMGAP